MFISFGKDAKDVTNAQPYNITRTAIVCIPSACCHSRMSGNEHIYEAWMERTFSDEQGRHVIHYYLASTSATPANPLLAVVATEYGGHRHYSYVVSRDFLEVFESNPAIIPPTELRTRNSVKEWLKSLVRKDDLPPTNSNLHGIAANERSVQETSGARLPGPTPREQASLQAGDNIEVLSKDPGMRDCWYRCKILESCNKCLKVQFNDRNNEEGSGKLEDYIPARRLAPPDNLGVRHSGRLIIRPCPPAEEAPTTFEVGAAVDAWWEDAWWEGFVLTVVSFSSSDGYHVFLPGRGEFLTLHRKDLRASRDWVSDTWVPIKSHPDIVSVVLSYFDNSHNSGGKSTQLSN